MRQRPPIPADTVRRQALAANPGHSAWVAANAGSGKTTVLARRVTRLLLAGTEPGRILCLTFTKAAAANMANRVFDDLARWIACDDAELDRALAGLDVTPSPEMRRQARRLFARALETPGGLKIQTIHAFCERVLQQFPFEAGVAARFSVLDDLAGADILARARASVITAAATHPETPEGQALARLVAEASDQSFGEVLENLMHRTEALAAMVAPGLDAAGEALAASLGLIPGDTPDSLYAEVLQSPFVPVKSYRRMADILSQGKATDQEKATEFINAADLAARNDGAGTLAALKRALLTQKGEILKRLMTKDLIDAHPRAAEALAEEAERVKALADRLTALNVHGRSMAAVTLGAAIRARVDAEKARRGALDFGDLVARTRDLLKRVDAAWVLYKLDLGIDHILIDEAQDTSPVQWEIVEALAAEFTAGAGARIGVKRTLFAVGDDKQSIFSFQGADPTKFDDMRRAFMQAFREAGEAFEDVRLDLSFRSAPQVLRLVDAVARGPGGAGLTADAAGPPGHTALRADAPGVVDLWPLEAPSGVARPEPWDAPFDLEGEESPRVKLSRRIAATIAGWVSTAAPLGDRGEPIRPGHVMILVQRRGPLFEGIIKALKDRGVPVAGADRLVVADHLAVMDLMALADAVTTPDDDLSLATVLKGPLFSFSDDDLFRLTRTRTSLSAALAASAVDRDQAAAATLETLRKDAAATTPFAFYAGVVAGTPRREGFRRRIVARLGVEANDPIDEFLSLALAHEDTGPAALRRFVAEVRAGRLEIKRDMDQGRDEVRVMTVHGAKGLEAPIVILADTLGRPEGPRAPTFLSLDPPGQGSAPPLLWTSGAAGALPPVETAKLRANAAAADEYRRLLYVALTRAEDRLIICGARGVQNPPAGCWYDLIDQAFTTLEAEGAITTLPRADGTTIRRLGAAPVETGPGAPDIRTDTGPPPPLPPLPGPIALAPATARLRPSRSKGLTTPDAIAARERGVLVHKLIEVLAGAPPEARTTLAARIAARAGGLPEALRAEAINAVTTLLADPAAAALFGPGSRAEVAVAGRIGRADGPPLEVIGRVDRLALAGGRLIVADFKTDRSPPATIPDAYLEQLALYRAVLRQADPARPVEAAIIWTAVPQIVPLDTAALDAALERVVSRSP